MSFRQKSTVLVQTFERRQTEPIFNFSLRDKHCFPNLQDHDPRAGDLRCSAKKYKQAVETTKREQFAHLHAAFAIFLEGELRAQRRRCMASRSSPHRGDYRAVKKPKRHETTDRPADRPAAFAGGVLRQNVIRFQADRPFPIIKACNSA